MISKTDQKRQQWREAVAAFYVSGVWIDCARAYRDSNPLCERCRKKGEISLAEQVHHKIKLTPENINNPDITLNWDNLEALCGDCHREEHRKQRRDEKNSGKRWKVDENGIVSC